jgi:hypothetical protein
MIVIRVELWSARTGRITEIARAHIINTSGRGRRRSYDVATFRGRSAEALAKREPQRKGRVENFPSEEVHVWNLVRKALDAMGYHRE